MRTMISSGNFAPPCETKYAGPFKCTGNTGVLTVASRSSTFTGHARRVRLEHLSGHAFCNVVNGDGSCFGRSTP